MVDWKKIALFAGGTLFGTAGVKILASDDAKKVYTQCTAAVLRAKDCVMKTVRMLVTSMKMQRRSMKNVQQQKRQQLLRTQRKQRKL